MQAKRSSGGGGGTGRQKCTFSHSEMGGGGGYRQAKRSNFNRSQR